MTLDEFIKQPTWCVDPFLQAHQYMDGRITPCCQYRGDMPNNIVKFINSTELRELKQDLMNGVQSPGCTVCWETERLGIESKRQSDNKTYLQRFKLLYNKKDLLEPNSNIAEYYIRLGNNCNLRCVTCNDFVSTGWASENKKFGLPYVKKNNIHQNDPIWQHILDHITHVKIIEFIGGEPLFINVNLQIAFLEKIVSSGRAKHIKLRYHTNGTKFNQRIVDLWREFNEVDVWISIDGIEKSFEYLRYPAKWSVLNTTLDKFFKASEESPNIKIKATCTVSVLNVVELPRIISWFNQLKIEYFLNLLSTPIEYNLYAQENNLKEKILHRLADSTLADVTKLLDPLLTESPQITTQQLKDKLTDLDQKRSLSYVDCLELGNLIV